MHSLIFAVRTLAGQSIRRRSLALGLWAALFGSLAASLPAQAAPADFVATWRNVDPATNSIVQVRIDAQGTGMVVHGYGACSPTPCDWGTTPLTTYGSNVSDPDHTYGTAFYDFGFVQTLMTFELANGRKTLIVNTYDRFTDGSGRQPYHSLNVFSR